MNNHEKPDLKNGVPLANIPDGGKLLGVVDGEEVLLVRRGTGLFAVGAYCTHYHGPLDLVGADGLVLFNRFYQPDLDLEQLEVVPRLELSHSYELLLRLNWVAILFGHMRPDLAITGGVHTAEDVLNSMMVGARVAMMTSALLESGAGHIRHVLHDLSHWMEEHEYESHPPDARQHGAQVDCRSRGFGTRELHAGLEFLRREEHCSLNSKMRSGG